MPFKNLLPRAIASIAVFVVLGISIDAQSSPAYMTEPALSPDRHEIAFVSGGDIWTVPRSGGNAQLLVSHPATESRPMYSPDGTKLAFASNRTGNGDIYVLDLTSGDLRRITFDDAAEVLDAWSRDGKWLYFSSTSKDISGMSDIFRVSVTGGTPMQVSADRYTNEYFSAPSPDGRSIAFGARGIGNSQWWRRGTSHIDEDQIYLKTGSEYKPLTDDGAKQLWPMWTPAGDRLYFVSDRGGTQNVWTMPIGGAAKPVTNFKDGRVLWANISYDGKQIVFERNFKIWQLDTGSGNASEVPITLRGSAAGPMTDHTSLAGRISDLALSPDGKKVAVIAHGEIYAASAKDGGDALKITDTAAPESFVRWAHDSRSIVYSSERNGTTQLFEYDFPTQAEKQLTQGPTDYAPVFSPDGKSLAFFRNGRDLMVLDVVSGSERRVCETYTDMPPLIGGNSVAWSPDGRWIAFLANSPETRSFTNVYVAPSAGGTARPLSFLANSNSGSVAWSPDGTYILFDTSQRTEDTNVARVDLKLRTPKFREDQFRDLFKEENPKQRPTTTATPSPSPQPTATATPESDSKRTEIVFDNIRDRLRLLSVGLDSGGPVISPDGKTLIVYASAQGHTNLYSVNLDELAADTSAKQVTSTTGGKSDAQFSPDSKELYYIENGRVMIADFGRRESRPLNLSLDMDLDFAKEKMEVFKQGWRYMRDNFFDEKYNGVDWQQTEKTYEPLIASARNMDEVRRLMSMMVGELNSSHLGVAGPSGFAATPVGKLGLRFDRDEYETRGRLKVTEIVELGPVDITRAVKVGDYLLSADGVRLDGGKNLDEVLENKVNRRVDLVFSPNGDEAGKHTVSVKPVSTGTEKNLLYRQWVAQNRAYVEKVSGGKLGYIHIPDMSSDSLNQMYIDLDVQNVGKEGVVVDIRNNNGGFTNPYVIDVLSRRPYLQMTERGRWPVPARANLGQRALERPTVLVTNRHSLSDAEDMTEGYRALHLGKVVGEPTAGWIVFTWNVPLYDGTIFRLPRQRITATNGDPMELHPRPVDVMAVRPIGESYLGRDSQLDAAVKTLLGDIQK